MSRRRHRRIYEHAIRLLVECDGSEKQPHAVVRIARVTVTPRPDLADANGGHAVHVDYVHAGHDTEDNDYTFPLRLSDLSDPHMTRRFPCRKCKRDKPVRDTALVLLTLKLAALDRRRVRLREIP